MATHGAWRLLALLLMALAAAVPGGRRAAADGTPVDLVLVLAVDVSGSVNTERFQLQKQGYADAFVDPKVIQAIRSGPLQSIAVAMTQWTGPSLQVDVVPWTLVHDEASARGLSAAIEAAPRALRSGGTSLSGAINHSVQLISEAPFTSGRRIIDVSGDGSNNRGRPAAEARDAAIASGISINGLPILTLEPELDAYYRDNVIGGPGAFVVAVTNYDDFAAAILSKLISEIAAVSRSKPVLASAACMHCPQ